MKALGRAAFGKDDLVPVEQDMDILHPLGLDPADAVVIDQMRGRDQHFFGAEQQLGPPTLHQHPVLVEEVPEIHDPV